MEKREKNAGKTRENVRKPLEKASQTLQKRGHVRDSSPGPSGDRAWISERVEGGTKPRYEANEDIWHFLVRFLSDSCQTLLSDPVSP